MNRYREAMARAEAAIADHAARHVRETVAWYTLHPEMLHPVIGEDGEGRVIRDTTRQRDLVQLCLPGWLAYCEDATRGREVTHWQMPASTESIRVVDGHLITPGADMRVVDVEGYLTAWNVALRQQQQRRVRAMWQQMPLWSVDVEVAALPL